MKRFITTACIASCAVIAALMFVPSEGAAQEGPPACSASGDMDADGVPDADDSDETDSCTATATGLEDCATGAGDGIPDCTPTGQ